MIKSLEQIKNELEDILDEQFPKDQSKERGAALVLFAYMMQMLKENKEGTKNV